MACLRRRELLHHDQVMSFRKARSAVAGQGLFSVQNVQLGARLFEIARPAVSVLDSSLVESSCSNCFAHAQMFGVDDDGVAPVLKTCMGCKTLRFCSKECQKQAWTMWHKVECKLLGILTSRTKQVLPNAARAVLRMLMMEDSAKAGLKALNSHWHELVEDPAHKRDEMRDMIKQMSEGVFYYTGEKYPLADVQQCFAIVR
ncbi:hypothetical protein MRB53_042035 [Persea americana]|nr:hypothetical protein MRB53_042035 [Persea americana]